MPKKTETSSEAAPALREIFDQARLLHIAAATQSAFAGFDQRKFLAICQRDLDSLSLMARLRRVTEALHATLPADYRHALAILRELAPKLEHRFVTLVLPDYVARYGAAHFDVSMEALRYFTPFGSAEFAIRPFLQADLPRTLRVMQMWAGDENEHVRRLASEGSRPRLPWSSRLDALLATPSPTAPILEALKADPAAYVRKSVANHLNDITKDHPAWALTRIESWDLSDPRTAWIAKHAVRSLIKKGDPRALAIVGAGSKADVRIVDFTITPEIVRLGGAIEIAFGIESTSTAAQRLVVDYAVHYVKKSGSTGVKVFKLKALTLAPCGSVPIRQRQNVRNLSTRTHYAGRHGVDILVNGACRARGWFDVEV